MHGSVHGWCMAWCMGTLWPGGGDVGDVVLGGENKHGPASPLSQTPF